MTNIDKVKSVYKLKTLQLISQKCKLKAKKVLLNWTLLKILFLVVKDF